MRRSIKYGIYGGIVAAVVAGVGGVVVYATAADPVHVKLVVDGQSKNLKTTASNVEGVLKQAHFAVGAHDIVAPSLTVEGQGQVDDRAQARSPAPAQRRRHSPQRVDHRAHRRPGAVGTRLLRLRLRVGVALDPVAARTRPTSSCAPRSR